jgi:hypothetical protein
MSAPFRFLLLLLLPLSPCRPASLLARQSKASDSPEESKKPIITVEDQGVTARSEYEGKRGLYLYFNVEVCNRGDQPMTVDPAQFVLINTKKGIKAISPEHRIRELDALIAAHKRFILQSQQCYLTPMVYKIEWANQFAALELGKAYSREQIEQLELERKTWDATALRATTLAPGQRLKGRVHFSALKMRKSQLVKLVVPLGTASISFEFLPSHT